MVSNPKQPWNLNLNSDFGPLSVLNQGLLHMQASNPGFLPQLRSDSGITVVSDYSESATFDTLSFLIIGDDRLPDSADARKQIRVQLSASNRTDMSYKKLNDSFRRKMLLPFLASANGIFGISITVAINKGVNSLFTTDPRLRANELGPNFSRWKDSVLEKAFRIVNFIGFFISGLCDPKQPILWITDEDPIVANEELLKETTDFCKQALLQYSQSSLWNLACRTTAQEDESLAYEDLASIPDLVAGAVSDVFTEYYELGTFPGSEQEYVLLPESVKPKSSKILEWFADDSHPLKRLVCLIPPRSSSWRIHLVNFTEL